MLSGGGLTTIETACRFPIRLVESGPAGGAIFSATHRAAMRPDQRAVVRHGRHHREDLPDRRLPAADRPRLRGRARRPLPQRLRPAAAHPGDRDGGDRRRRRLDRRMSTAMGRIAVGPESAGADPGPACYGRGGTQPGGDRRQPGARPLRPGALRRRHAAARPGRRARCAGGRGRRAARPRRGDGGARRRRDGRREHGQRRARARDRDAARPTTAAP